MARNTLTLNADGTLDGVQMAIINKRMEAICAKMANTLLRTGRSGVLNSARDFSCCIVTAENGFSPLTRACRFTSCAAPT